MTTHYEVEGLACACRGLPKHSTVGEPCAVGDGFWALDATHVRTVVAELTGKRRWSSAPGALPARRSAPRPGLRAFSSIRDDGRMYLMFAWGTGHLALRCEYQRTVDRVLPCV